MTPDEPMDDAPDPELDSLVRAALTPQEQRDATRARLLMRAKAQKPETAHGSPAKGSRVSVATIGLGLALAASLVLLVRSNSDRAEMQKTFLPRTPSGTHASTRCGARS